MALAEEIVNVTKDGIKKHLYKTDATGNLISLITGVAGKRIKIWRLFAVASANKTCIVLSGTNPFTILSTQMINYVQLWSNDGIPCFTCNPGEDFKVDPSDATAWYWYIVYSID